MDSIKKTFQYGSHTVTLETGAVARQASAAVTVNMDDTVVLVTVVAQKEAKPGQGFFPLTVNYQERFYAGGRIPGRLLQARRPSDRSRNADVPADRPSGSPLVPEGLPE